MTEIDFSTSVKPVPLPRRDNPGVAGTAVAFTDNRHDQDEVAAALTGFAERLRAARGDHGSGRGSRPGELS